MEFGSEGTIAKAMLAQLSEAFIVMHSLPWLFPSRDDEDAPAREGEADFLVLHRKHGVLVLEVKGGDITLKDRTWYRHVGGGLKPIKDPARQARRSLWVLKRRVAAVCGAQVADGICFASAVAFPHCVFKDRPPPDLPSECIITSDDLADLGSAIVRAYRSGVGGGELSPQAFEAVRRALAPEFRIYEPLKVGVDADGLALARLTGQQLQVLRGFEGNGRAIIEGVAGSGKTLLAIQRARSFASTRRSVLLTCFNVELAKWMAEDLADILVENGGNVTVANFHKLAADMCKRAGTGFTPSSQDPARWWDEIAPDLLATAAMELHPADPAFEAIVVDEAQDFSPGWWDALAYLNGDVEGAPIWAFLDKAQSLRREPVDPPIPGAFRFSLDLNCRNTRRIVACANTATRNGGSPFDLAPLGRVPKLIVPQTPPAIGGLVLNELRDLLGAHRLEPRQIVVISPSTHANGPLSAAAGVDRTAFVDSALDWRKGKGILLTTARRFKGLEADAVVLCDFAGIGGSFTLRDLYVALTRARSHLVIVAHDRRSAEVFDVAIAAAGAIGRQH